MRLDDLRFYIYEKERLLKEIDVLSAKIENGIASPTFSESGTKTHNSNDDKMYKIMVQNIKIQDLLKKRYAEVVKIIESMYKIINSIEDIEIKQIVELRAIKGMTFEEIGEELHYDKSTISRKYQNFINDIKKIKIVKNK